MKRLFDSKDRENPKRKDSAVFDFGYYKKNVHNVGQWWAFVAVVFVLSLSLLSRHIIHLVPEPLTLQDEPTNPESFISERAYTDLRILNDFGPRVTGYYANDILAVDFFKREVNHIQQSAHANQKIYAEVQKATGAYWIGLYPHGMTNSYHNVQNVVVKLIGQNENAGISNAALLVNCHFDTVPGSPGASDDAANCCVMLEILRVLSKQPTALKHSIIFLFNGAEETPLEASHGFITSHPWAKDVKAFLNLESGGSGGKEFLFQSGPNHGWLVEMYRKAAIHPSGLVAAEELFQANLIPSETDFRVFRDFGNVPGMDFANVFNGYRYHTKFDSIDFVSKADLQRTGDNMLSLVQLMGNSKELANTEEHKEGKKVYFDFFGYVFISYPANVGIFVHILIAILAVVLPQLSLSKTTGGIHRKYIRRQTFIGFINNLLSIALSTAVCLTIAYELDFTGNSLSWFNNSYLAILLYAVPTVFISSLVHKFLNQSKTPPFSLSLLIQARLNGSNLLWSFLTIAMVLVGFRTAYILAIPLLFSLISNTIISITGIQNSIRKWLYVHIVYQAVIILWTTYIYLHISGLMMPIAGRWGESKNPDILISLIVVFFTVFTTSYLIPLIGLLNKTKCFLWTLFGIFIFTRIGLISFSNIGFPYRDNSTGYPTPQRHYIVHTARTFYDQVGQVRFSDSGYWARSMDRNAERTIESLFAPDIPISNDENKLCGSELFCGLPFYSSRQLGTGGFWVPGPAPIINEVISLSVVEKLQLGEFDKQVTLTIPGNAVLTLLIAPKADIVLTGWSITDRLPEPNEFLGQKAYLVKFTCGIDAAPKNVSFNFKSTKANYEGPLFDVNLVSYHYEYYHTHTAAFAQLLSKIPSWAYAVPAVASVHSYTI